MNYFPQSKTFQFNNEPSFSATKSDNPAYYLEYFISEDFIDSLTIQANAAKDKTFTKDEIRCFLAVLYLSGYLEVAKKRMLWERSPDTFNSLVANAIARDRFEAIYSSLECGNFNRILEIIYSKFLGNCLKDEREFCVGKIGKFWVGSDRSGYCSYLLPDAGKIGPWVILDFAYKLKKFVALEEVSFENVYADNSLLYELGYLGVRPCFAKREVLEGLGKVERNLSNHPIKYFEKSLDFRVALDLVMSNAFTLYKDSGNSLDLLGFKRSCVVYYLERCAKVVNVDRSVSFKKRIVKSEARYDGFNHYVVPQAKQTRCGECSAKTTTRCCKCDVGVHVKCFLMFHTK